MLTSSPVGLGQTRPFPTTALIILLFFPFYRKLSQTLVVKGFSIPDESKRVSKRFLFLSGNLSSVTLFPTGGLPLYTS